MVQGEAIEWSELSARLAESNGGAVLEELILDRMVRAELKRRGLAVGDAEVRRERELLERTVARTASVGPDERARLVEQVRRARGLGPIRFESMLTRNAGLRRLVRDDVVIQDEDVRAAFDARYGPKYVVRLIVVASEADASAARARVTGAGGGNSEPFGEVAWAVSIDQSKYRGGLQEPMAPTDPTVPAAIRTLLPTMGIGDVSNPVAVDGGWALIRLEEKRSAEAVSFEGVRAELLEEIRLVRERVLMDKQARQMLASAKTTIFDRGLDWSWRARESQQGSPPPR